MRYYHEFLRIYQEYDNNTNAIHDVLLNLNWEGNWKSNDLTSLGHKLTRLSALCRLRNEAIKFVLNCSQVSKVDSKVCKKPSVTPDETVLAKFQEKILTQLAELDIQLDIYNVRVKQLREEVKATLIACGHCDPAYFLPYLEVGNQDQVATLQILLQWVYPNGRSHCSNPKAIETEATTEATNELPNMSLDSEVIETEAQKNDMITVDLKTQDTQLDPKQKPIPKKVTESEAPKNDMVTVDLNTHDTRLNSKPNPMPKKTMTPRYKFKRIKKGGKVQKIQSPGVHTMTCDPSHKITDSQNAPIESPNISCDSTILDTGITKGDSAKMDLEVQDTKQNYKTKALKMSKENMPQMSLIKKRGKCGKVRKLQTPRMYKKKLKSQLDMRAKWSLKSKHQNNVRLHNKTLNTKFMALRGIMKSVMGAFHNTFPLQDRLLLKRPRVKIK